MMDQAVYEIESLIEKTHWWFVGRRSLFRRILRELDFPHTARILDVGSGTGANLMVPVQLGFIDVTGVDASAQAVKFCQEKGCGKVRQGDICDLPFPNDCFEIVLATDVIEHVDDDLRALSEIHRVLVPSGRALITVPAFRCLWGIQDEVGHHKRRYRKKQLRRVLRQAGFVVDRLFYFNYLLFLPILLTRKMIRLFKIRVANENNVNSSTLNALFGALFAFDVATAPYIRPPFGVSVFALVRKVEQDSATA